MAVHDYIKSGDFATEKHVPVIETVEGTQLPFEVGEISFNVHGDGATANEGPVHAISEGSLAVSLNKSGKLIAVSYCNIHGLWESEKEITVA